MEPSPESTEWHRSAPVTWHFSEWPRISVFLWFACLPLKKIVNTLC